MPNTIKARFASACSCCDQVIETGQDIRAASGWRHDNCASRERVVYRDRIVYRDRFIIRDAPPGTSAIYSDRVAKLLNLAVGASTDAEAMTAFTMARNLHEA